MKKYLSLLILVFGFFQTAFAEYNGSFIKFQMETDSETIEGHIYVARAYFDLDLKGDQDYLKGQFDIGDHNRDGVIHFCHRRLEYRFSWEGSTEFDTIYGISDQDSIAVDLVKSIEVLEIIDQGYLVSLDIMSAIEDINDWTKSEPVQYVRDGATMCDWQIFIHKRSPKTEKVLAELEAYGKSYERRYKKLEEELSHYQEDENLKKKMEKLEEEGDKEKARIISRFKGEKVAIITFCSC